MIRIINENNTNILVVKEIKNILNSIDSDINELNINGLLGIEIVNDSNFYGDSDGKFVGDRIILPKDNEKDLNDLPEEVRSKLDIHLVSDIKEVLEIALEK